jgi:hypothetical protein
MKGNLLDKTGQAGTSCILFGGTTNVIGFEAINERL